jgi:hypothetical protein
MVKTEREGWDVVLFDGECEVARVADLSSKEAMDQASIAMVAAYIQSSATIFPPAYLEPQSELNGIQRKAQIAKYLKNLPLGLMDELIEWALEDLEVELDRGTISLWGAMSGASRSYSMALAAKQTIERSRAENDPDFWFERLKKDIEALDVVKILLQAEAGRCEKLIADHSTEMGS